MPRLNPSIATVHMSLLALVSAAFCSIYLTQPQLPTLQVYFDTTLPTVSATVSLLIVGFALANIPVGIAADQWPIKRLIGLGGAIISTALYCSAMAQSIEQLIFARFITGISIPFLTTCVVTWFSQTETSSKLQWAMGKYVAATVLGGFSGRVISGVLFSPEQWRWAFVFVATLTVVGTLRALSVLPADSQRKKSVRLAHGSFLSFLKRPELLMLYACGGSGLALFGSVFNYLPYRLSQAPFDLSSRYASSFYCCYLVGIVTAPLAGKWSEKLGATVTLLIGIIGITVGLVGLLWDQLTITMISLLFLSAGYFMMHSTAVGALNRKLAHNQGKGRANALYVLFYYLGGSLGIQAGGYIFQWGGWRALLYFCLGLLLIPVMTLIFEYRHQSK